MKELNIETVTISLDDIMNSIIKTMFRINDNEDLMVAVIERLKAVRDEDNEFFEVFMEHCKDLIMDTTANQELSGELYIIVPIITAFEIDKLLPTKALKLGLMETYPTKPF